MLFIDITAKQANSQMESRQTALVQAVGGGGVERLSKKGKKKRERKRTHGHGPQCGDCGGKGRVEVGESIERMNADGKNKIQKDMSFPLPLILFSSTSPFLKSWHSMEHGSG